VLCDSEVMLKMLADDRYCGRIIGKEGKMIKKIREDTGTKITVSKYVSLSRSTQTVAANHILYFCSANMLEANQRHLT